MDWVWTDTTLSLSSWICVEDVYAHCFVLKCWRESEKVTARHRLAVSGERLSPELCVCLCVSTEVPTATRTEEEAGGEVRDGWPYCPAAHLHRLVPAPLHVPHQVCGRSRQSAAGRLAHHHAGRLPGEMHLT